MSLAEAVGEIISVPLDLAWSASASTSSLKIRPTTAGAPIVSLR